MSENNKLVIGLKVEAKYYGNDQYYRAEIISIQNNNSYTVVFLDDNLIQENTLRADIRADIKSEKNINIEKKLQNSIKEQYNLEEKQRKLKAREIEEKAKKNEENKKEKNEKRRKNEIHNYISTLPLVNYNVLRPNKFYYDGQTFKELGELTSREKYNQSYYVNDPYLSLKFTNYNNKETEHRLYNNRKEPKKYYESNINVLKKKSQQNRINNKKRVKEERRILLLPKVNYRNFRPNKLYYDYDSKKELGQLVSKEEYYLRDQCIIFTFCNSRNEETKIKILASNYNTEIYLYEDRLP